MFLAGTLDSVAGLNPRAYRNVEGDVVLGAGGMGMGMGQGRGIVDGNLLGRLGELGEQRRKEGLGKVGAEEWVVRAEMEVLMGRGVFGGMR